MSGHRHVAMPKDRDATNDKPRPLERVVRALNSGRLQFRSESATDLDWLTALGMSSAANPGHSALVRLHYVQDEGSYEAALRLAVQIVRRVSARQRWRLHEGEVVRLSKVSLAFHILPVCPCCRGTRFEKIPGTPHLSNRPCPKCHGTGLRPYPIKDAARIRDVVAHLAAIERATEHAVERRMRRP